MTNKPTPGVSNPIPTTTERLVALSNQVSRSTVAVIEAVAQRGGFRGEELLPVGQLREQCIQISQLWEALQREQAESVADSK